MATVANQIQKIYIGLLGRAADAEGLAYWTDEIESGALTLEQLRANIVEEQPEYLQGMGQMTRAQVVNQLYQNLFNRSAEPEGLDYWVNGGGSSVNVDQLVLALVDGAQAADTLALDNKTVIAEYYTQAAGENYSEAAARAAIANVDGSTDLAAARAAVDALLEGPASAETLTLTQRADDLQGADGVDTTFTAPVTQNETGSGALANTFETGDVLDGGADSTNVLRADLIATGTIQDVGQGAAISATTTNIQEVYFRAQAGQVDGGGSNTTFAATIDAERMEGVEQWWTDSSRADIRIEDVRSRADEVAIGMRNTDPGVGYEVYFNPLFMEGDISETESALTLTIQDITDGQAPSATELENITVREINFTLGGEDYTLDSEAMRAANSWEELEAAIAAELGENGLEGVSIEHRGNGVFVLEDGNSRSFEVSADEALIFGAASDIDVRNRVDVGEPVAIEGQTSTTIVLDGVGAGSRGGSLNVAAMSGDRGVEVFDVAVGANSHLTSMSSVNSPNTTNRSFDLENQLEEVYVSHLEGAAGSLKIGSRTELSTGVSTTTDDRLQANGLTDVRVFDASGFDAELMLGAALTTGVFNKYLDGAEDTVQFSYLLGDGGSNLSLAVDNTVASDPDFALEIVGGAGDDRINLSNPAEEATGLQFKASTSIDGAGGNNIVEIDTTTGAAAGGNTAAQNSWAAFDNIQTLVVAGDTNTIQNLVVGNMEGLEEVVIATGNVDTTMQQMRMDQDLTISGKNQTLSGASNAAQSFGTIAVQGTSAVPGVDSFGITLDNTARLNGELSVDALNITDLGNTQSAIRTLELTSAGRRDTVNTVNSLDAARVHTLNLLGTQDLNVNVTDLAAATGQAMTVDASELEGDLNLGMAGALLNQDSDDVLTGTAGDNDTLTLTGAMDVSSTISEFETIVFSDGAAGSFDASGVSGVELYEIDDLAGDLGLENLRSTETVQINDDISDDITLSAASRSANSELTVNFRATEADAEFSGELEVNDYRTISLDMGGASGEALEFDFSLVLNGYENADGDEFANHARTLNITGGEFDVDASGDRINVDSLELQGLASSLTLIDLSGYQGNFEGSFGAVNDADGDPLTDWATEYATNTVIRVGEFGFEFDIAGNTETITTFRFTADAYEEGVVWEIDSFQALGAGGVNLSNVSVLDLRDLGIEGLADIVIDDSSGNTVITSNLDQNFEIVLTGLTDADLLNNENFAFA